MRKQRDRVEKKEETENDTEYSISLLRMIDKKPGNSELKEECRAERENE